MKNMRSTLLRVYVDPNMKAARDKVGKVLSKSAVADLVTSITVLRPNIITPMVWYFNAPPNSRPTRVGIFSFHTNYYI